MHQNSPYELVRDNTKFPCCWNAENNFCAAHFHSTIEVVYVIEGELEAVVNGRVYTVRKGNFLVISSYFIHAYTTKTQSQIYIFTTPLEMIQPYQSALAEKIFAQILVEDSMLNSELVQCMAQLEKVCLGNIGESLLTKENILKGYTCVFIGLLIDRIGLIDVQKDKTIFLSRDILKYLQDNYKEPLTLDMAAKHFGYSRCRFSHIFNKFFGCNLVEYINGLRCRHALEMLMHKETTITEISMSCGFESTRTFYRVFKSQYQCTPLEYVKRHK